MSYLPVHVGTNTHVTHVCTACTQKKLEYFPWGLKPFRDWVRYIAVLII